MSLYKSWSRHQPQTYTVEHTWILDNFKILQQFDKLFDQESPKFPDNIFKTPNDTKFYLKIKPDNEYLGLTIFTTCPENSSEFLTLIITITLGNEKVINGKYSIKNKMDFWSVRYTDLFDNDSELLPDGKLIINVEIAMIGDILCTTQHGDVNALKVPKCKLSADFYAPFQTGDFSDVTIETADGHKLKAHKVILSARSTVFAAMFSHEMKESQENCIKITDFNGNVVTEMLRFIYTGEAPNLNELNDDLLAAADKYALDRLKALCAESLRSKLSKKNAIQVYNLADLHNIENLKTAAQEYIYCHCNSLQSLNIQKLISVFTSAELLSDEEKSVASIKDETE